MSGAAGPERQDDRCPGSECGHRLQPMCHAAPWRDSRHGVAEHNAASIQSDAAQSVDESVPDCRCRVRGGPMLSDDVSQGLHPESEQSKNLFAGTAGSNVFCVYTTARLTQHYLRSTVAGSDGQRSTSRRVQKFAHGPGCSERKAGASSRADLQALSLTVFLSSWLRSNTHGCIPGTRLRMVEIVDRRPDRGGSSSVFENHREPDRRS